MMMLWVDLGLSEDVKRISNEQQVHIYNEYMGKLEQECIADLTELFLEKSDLFGSDLFDQLSSSPKEAFDRVHQELKVGEEMMEEEGARKGGRLGTRRKGGRVEGRRRRGRVGKESVGGE
jgi:hypothetical protein